MSRLRSTSTGTVAQPRDLLGDMPHERRLVALAAIRHRREIRAVGLDQHAVERHAPRDVLQLDRVLERDDARERDVEAEVERGARDVPRLGEAVHDAARLARATDRREAARLEILRALERGDLDIESASHKLEILEDAGPRFFRGWCSDGRRPARRGPPAGGAQGRLYGPGGLAHLAALDHRAGFAPEGAPDATPPPSAGPGWEPPGGFGSQPAAQLRARRRVARRARGGPSILRIEVTDAGRQVVNLRLPIAVGKFALDRIPGLPAEQVSFTRRREMVAAYLDFGCSS